MITLSEALMHGRGQWRSFNCPDHDDNSPSARVNTLTGRWVCMVCGSRGAQETYEPPERLVIEQVRRLTQEKRDVSESYLDMFDSSGPGEYWLSRFTKEACQHFRLGYDVVKEKSLYPIRDLDGGFLGVVYRNFPGEKPKYRYPRGINTSELLFEYHNADARSPIVIVEGAPDVIALWEAGIPALGTFGARLLPAQQQALCRLEPSVVVLAYDRDEAGFSGAHRAAADLSELGIRTVQAAWEGYNDVGDMPLEVRSGVFRDIFGKYCRGT